MDDNNLTSVAPAENEAREERLLGVYEDLTAQVLRLKGEAQKLRLDILRAIDEVKAKKVAKYIAKQK